jgi:hypothetical protein
MMGHSCRHRIAIAIISFEIISSLVAFSIQKITNHTHLRQVVSSLEFSRSLSLAQRLNCRGTAVAAPSLSTTTIIDVLVLSISYGSRSQTLFFETVRHFTVSRPFFVGSLAHLIKCFQPGFALCISIYTYVSV